MARKFETEELAIVKDLWADVSTESFVKTDGHTGNIVPVGAIGDSLPKILCRVQLLTRVPFVHQRVLLQHTHTQTRTRKWCPHYVLETARISAYNHGSVGVWGGGVIVPLSRLWTPGERPGHRGICCTL